MINSYMDESKSESNQPGLWELAAAFFKIGIMSFGGAAAQIALMHRVVVEERKWLDELRYLHALNYCMLLPGPEAQQLATYVGWQLKGIYGGLITGLLFIIPGALIMLGLGALYVFGTGVSWIDGAFFGIKAAVLALVVQALIKIGARSLSERVNIAIALAAFIAFVVFDLPFPIVILGAGLFGFLAASKLHVLVPDDIEEKTESGDSRLSKTVMSIVFCGLVWWAPVLIVYLTLGGDHVLVKLGVFFSELAMVTFGGAYALLAWLSQEAVNVQGWVTATEMLDGLGLAETTPGPTVLVTQFVGFLAAFRSPEPFGPLTAGVFGALLTVWVTFAPSFLWIFVGAPYIEDLRSNRRLAAALSGITAAVVGTIAYLAIWFALNVLFGSVEQREFWVIRYFAIDLMSLDWRMATLSAIAFTLVFKIKASLAVTVGGLATLGIVITQLVPAL